MKDTKTLTIKSRIKNVAKVMVDRATPGSSKPPWAVVTSSDRKEASVNFHQLRTTASKASIQKQIIVDAFGTAPRKPVVDGLWAALSCTPVVRRHLSPLFLRRVSSFEVYCEKTGVFPEFIDRNGFYLPILEKQTIRLSEPFCLDEDRRIFCDHLRDRGYDNILEVSPVFLAGLCNASLLKDGSIVSTCDNIQICDPSHYPSWVNLGNNFSVPRPPLFIPRVDLKLSGEYLHFGSLGGLNYYHWVVEVLPRLLFAERFDRLSGMPLLVQRGITQAQRESLQMLGIPPDRIIEFTGSHWQVEQLYYIHHGCGGKPTPLVAQWLRERFAPHSTMRSRRLYISREDATKRRIVNETDLLKELVRCGFEAVTLSGMSFADQARLFNEAEIIVGPHGAGFTNAVFAQAGATLIELFSPIYIDWCYRQLANACGHRYGFMIGTQHGEDIKADIGKFLRLLTSMN
jgi:hypothetical protein